jgi:hypothetical protein
MEMDLSSLTALPPRPSADAFLRGATPSPGRSARRRERFRRSRYDQELVAAKCRCLESVVAATFRLSRAELRGASRGEAQIAFARQVAMYVAHVWFALPLTEVGRRFDRDRTTVAHACRVVEDRRDDPRIDRVVAAIESAAELWHRLPQAEEIHG